ncbi:hypothetical protein BC938DRAFT_475538 [Jimgerdemannia flammicorona]|uniref:Uncharacterized protein n=1 Tax=Jimgerdemannia flammicorona TaxID=994334 RepID=A0A433QRL1_9FUNG|nr:hypothetical protein BC938DRAFT_475538 [Jimgerdemannia flammicorona]
MPITTCTPNHDASRGDRDSSRSHGLITQQDRRMYGDVGPRCSTKSIGSISQTVIFGVSIQMLAARLLPSRLSLSLHSNFPANYLVGLVRPIPLPHPALPPRLFQYPDPFDLHSLPRGFAHIKHGQQRDAHGCQCFHLNPRARHALNARLAPHAALLSLLAFTSAALVKP